MNFDYAQLKTLAAILRTGSFEAAASELHITQSAVSQRLKALEEQVGTRLVHRETPCRGTDAGTRLAAHAGQVAALEQSLSSDLNTQTPDRTARLAIAVNADSLATWFLGPISQMQDQYFDLVIDDQDFSIDLLRKGEVAGAVTTHSTPVTGCDVHYLGKIRYRATASPAYCAKHLPDGPTPEAIAKAPALHFNVKDSLQAKWLETNVGTDIRPPFHSLASSHGFVDACLLGIGWGTNPEALVAPHMKSGKLVEIMPNTPIETPLYWQNSRLLRPALASLTKAICQTARKSLPQ